MDNYDESKRQPMVYCYRGVNGKISYGMSLPGYFTNDNERIIAAGDLEKMMDKLGEYADKYEKSYADKHPKPEKKLGRPRNPNSQRVEDDP